MTNVRDRIEAEIWKMLKASGSNAHPDAVAECAHHISLTSAGEPDVCSVCVGTGRPVSGLPCICGGTGSEAAEIAGLRRELFRCNAENERFRTRLAKIEEPLPTNDVVVLVRNFENAVLDITSETGNNCATTVRKADKARNALFAAMRHSREGD